MFSWIPCKLVKMILYLTPKSFRSQSKSLRSMKISFRFVKKWIRLKTALKRSTGIQNKPTKNLRMAITGQILDAASPSKTVDVISSSESSDSEDDTPLSSLVSAASAAHESRELLETVSEFMPLDGFSDLDEENVTTAELLSQAISTVDDTTNVSYYLGNTNRDVKWSVHQGFYFLTSQLTKNALYPFGIAYSIATHKRVCFRFIQKMYSFAKGQPSRKTDKLFNKSVIQQIHLRYKIDTKRTACQHFLKRMLTSLIHIFTCKNA